MQLHLKRCGGAGMVAEQVSAGVESVDVEGHQHHARGRHPYIRSTVYYAVASHYYKKLFCENSDVRGFL